MNAIVLGTRLRAVRKSRSFTQKEVADALSLPRTAISQLEAGTRSVSTLELVQLSELYHRHVSDLLDEKAMDEVGDVLAALHRVAPGLEKDPDTNEQVARRVHLFREGFVLERLLGDEARSSPPRYDRKPPRSRGEAAEQGEEAAEQERGRLGIADSPIGDVAELIASQSIWASSASLPGAMSGLFIRHPSVGMAVLANASQPNGRKRFSYAHEYAHALFDRDRSIAISSGANSSDLAEVRASAFAAAFLMPRAGIRACLGHLGKDKPSRRDYSIFDSASGVRTEASQRSPSRSQRVTCMDIARIARRFRTSYRAAACRLKSLRHVSEHECSALLDRESFGRRFLESLCGSDVFKKEREEDRDRELRSEIARLAIEAYRRGEISRGRILELSRPLRIKGDALLRLAEEACGNGHASTLRT